jgi:deoxyribodipyrimidine photo-lyase
MVVLFVFRRDLRLQDNTALNEAIRYTRKHKDRLVLAFAFTPEQVQRNPYFNERAFRFMVENLDRLNRSVKYQMSFFYDTDFYQRIPDLRAVFFNEDYTPYARQRDQSIRSYCEKQGIHCGSYEDYTLHAIDRFKTKENTGYKVFGAFYKRASKEPVRKSYTVRIDVPIHLLGSARKKSSTKDYRAIALKSSLSRYDREFPYEDRTSRLGPYIKFGVISIRELFHKHRKQKEFIKQLYWREFYANVAFHYPHVLSQSADLKPVNRFVWNKDPSAFRRWCDGTTGVPIVDAGMRQLLQTGFMHNRLRMITASFLTKNLRIDWRKGERHFAKHLLDYDPASNNGGWQWVAGTGTDAAPYFRVMNPWTQAQRYDPDAKFIQRHVPELRALTPKEIHNEQNHRPMDHYTTREIIEYHKSL